MKVVLDTNVLIAAFISHGVCNELLEHCAIHHEITLSPFILDEVREKLIQKFDFSIREAGAVIQLLKSRVVLVTPHKLQKPICRDQDDDNILGTALAGNCECIVTGDKDLLALQRIQDVRIVTPNEFWSTEK
jgi:putative PIN family toxin of toxin-antitoxin system